MGPEAGALTQKSMDSSHSRPWENDSTQAPCRPEPPPLHQRGDGATADGTPLADVRAEFIDSIDGIVWEADLSLRFIFVSKHAERILGYPLEQWREPDFWVRHLHPEDRDAALAYCLAATAARRPHQLEYRMVAADGRVVWLRDIVTVVSERECPARVRGIMVDVSEQRQTQERLERAVSLLQATLESTADGLLVVDLAGRITAFNRRFQDMWGLGNGLLGSRRDEPALEAVRRQVKDPEQFLARVGALYAAPERESFDVLELRDGRVLERYSRPQRLGDSIIGRVWSFRDITQRVLAERERDRLLAHERAARARREESLALLDTFLDNAPIGLAFHDRELRYLRLNASLAALNGGRPEDYLGRTVHEVMPETGSRIEPLMRRVMDTGEPLINLEVTAPIPTVPDEPRDWRVSFYPVTTPSLGTVGVGAVVVEVTKERRAQAERERLLREAQEAIRLRDDFLAIATHELKTPLTPLRLHLQVMRQRLEAGGAVALAQVDKALAQLGRLTGLVNDLLDTSRIEAGRLELRRAPLSLRDAVGEMVAAFRPVSPHHTLLYEESSERLDVLADAERIAQVLTNLLENALKYSPSGGTVRVTVERRGAQALVSVADEGIGIPRDQEVHLFERFFRARNAPISGFGGLGLGLYICRDIIERHGGRIWVDSEVGHGATFRFTLPLLEGAAHEARAALH